MSAEPMGQHGGLDADAELRATAKRLIDTGEVERARAVLARVASASAPANSANKVVCLARRRR